MSFKSASAKVVGVVLLIVGLCFAVIGIVYQIANQKKIEKTPTWVLVFIVIGIIFLFFGAIVAVGGAMLASKDAKKIEEGENQED